jgi:hypothetical protein
MMRDAINTALKLAALAVLQGDKWFQAVCADAELAAEYAREVVDLRQQVETLTRMLDHSERKVAHWKHQAGMIGADVEGLVH